MSPWWSGPARRRAPRKYPPPPPSSGSGSSPGPGWPAVESSLLLFWDACLTDPMGGARLWAYPNGPRNIR